MAAGTKCPVWAGWALSRAASHSVALMVPVNTWGLNLGAPNPAEHQRGAWGWQWFCSHGCLPRWVAEEPGTYPQLRPLVASSTWARRRSLSTRTLVTAASGLWRCGNCSTLCSRTKTWKCSWSELTSTCGRDSDLILAQPDWGSLKGSFPPPSPEGPSHPRGDPAEGACREFPGHLKGLPQGQGGDAGHLFPAPVATLESVAHHGGAGEVGLEVKGDVTAFRQKVDLKPECG